MAESSTPTDADTVVGLGRALGARRLKALLLLSQHPELDEVSWVGQVLLHFGERSVKGAVHPAPRELGGPTPA